MFQTCPATGRLSHRFDPATHQCACGRWERGFKPKAEKVNARDRGECQICEGKFSMLGGRLGHHGYKRPGCGYILGDCMGVGHAPYPATDALVSYRRALEGRLVAVETEIARLQSPDLKGVESSRVLNYNVRRQDRITVPFTILRGARACSTPGLSHASFEDALRVRVAALQNEASWYRADLKRVNTRIAVAKNPK